MIAEIIFHPEAEREFTEAYLWYEEKQAGLGRQFKIYVDRQLSLVAQNPENYPTRKSLYRESKVATFPYIIVYKFYPETQVVYVVCIFHTSREPGKKNRTI